uniref:Uncharacterized protein n=1 Tax=Ranid herpesvirus 4 TaxID=2849006 RepID=A0A8F3CIK4_9VIRU|nr:MAG: hypothetical protein [Ranid herpesvirus 4]
MTTALEIFEFLANMRMYLWKYRMQNNDSEFNANYDKLLAQTLEFPHKVPPGLKAGVHLYMYCLREGLIYPFPHERLKEKNIVSLQDYDNQFTQLHVYYNFWTLENIDGFIKDLLLFWNYILIYPVLPDQLDDLTLCVYCLGEADKTLERYKYNLTEQYCCHYALHDKHSFEYNIDNITSVYKTACRQKTNSLPLEQDASLIAWFEGTSNTKDTVKSRMLEDELWMSTQKTKAQHLEDFNNLIKLVKVKNNKLKLENRLATLNKQAATLEKIIVSHYTPRYIILEPFVQLHYFIYHLNIKKNTIANLNKFLTPALQSSDYDLHMDRLKTSSVNSTEIIRAFYTLILPPNKVYNMILNPRFEVVNMLFGARVTMTRITEFRDTLKRINYKALCGVPYSQTDLVRLTCGEFYSTDIWKLLWAITNIHAYCITENDGKPAWCRADDSSQGELHKCKMRFIHVRAEHWYIQYVHICGKQIVFSTERNDLLQCLSSLMSKQGS